MRGTRCGGPRESFAGSTFETVEIVYLKLEFTFRLHGKQRRIVVKIKPPRTVSFRRDVFEARIMEHLRRNGLCVPRPTLFSAAAAD